MCDTKPGLRCATDTRGAHADAAARYRTAHPQGTAVDPVAAASAGFEEQGPASAPSATAEQVRATVQDRFPGVDLWLREPDSGGYVVLDKIVVPQGSRRSGVGTAVMIELAEVADRNGWRLALTPSTDFGGSRAGLERFYRRFGFVPNRGRAKDYGTRESFIRAPAPATADAP